MIDNSKKKHFLFLQGMASSFFRRVGIHLVENNCRISRINFCIGDWIFWHGNECYNFRGKLSEWDNYIRQFMKDEKVSHIVLVGEQRKYHNTAIKFAKELGIHVIATDFGYLRPDWIAIEEDGMNGNSHIPKNIEEILLSNKDLPKANLKKIYSDSEFNMISRYFIYNFTTLFDFIFFPNYIRSDMAPNPVRGLLFSLKKWIKLYCNKKKTMELTDRIEAGKLKFFLYAMQLEHDFQIVSYSQYENLLTPLREIMQSYRDSCNKNFSLVIKNHPCDLGIKNWQKIISKLAREYNIEKFVHYVEGGTSLDKFLKHAKGLITVNSTSGLKALQLGCPVITLSSAVYNMEGITYQGKLDDFWSNSQTPIKKNIDAFINVVASKFQVKGVFFKEPGMSNGIKEFAEKLINEDVGL
ncbi:MAG: capsular biosynthesis protein [bacterium]|nr:capsular biosynthesis protein [bacterium]